MQLLSTCFEDISLAHLRVRQSKVDNSEVEGSNCGLKGTYELADSARIQKEGLPGIAHVVLAGACLAGKRETGAGLERLKGAV
jgi:hypothetical protein